MRLYLNLSGRMIPPPLSTKCSFLEVSLQVCRGLFPAHQYTDGLAPYYPSFLWGRNSHLSRPWLCVFTSLMVYSPKLKLSSVKFFQRRNYLNWPSLQSGLIIPCYLSSSLIPLRCVLHFIQHFQLSSMGVSVSLHTEPTILPEPYHTFLHYCPEAAKLVGGKKSQN